MAREREPVEARPLLVDADGALPRPWVAFKKVEPPDKGCLYYHNLVTAETKWERPQVQIPRQSVYRDNHAGGRPAFTSWRDLSHMELPAATPAEAAAAFREFCARLLPHGSFGRKEDGMLWRLDEEEPVGIVLYPAKRHLAVTYDPRFVGPADLGMAAGTLATAPLNTAARLAAMGMLQRGLTARLTAQAALAAPEGHLLRRYLAQVGGAAPTQRVPRAAVAGESPLVSYLESLQLLRPLSCGLAGLGDLGDEAGFAAHLLSEQHRRRRAHLRSAVELLAEVRRGEVRVSDWLPVHAGRYRGLLQWCDRRFQDMPMADGRVFRFDHLSGLGMITPASNWAALGHVPPPLVPPGPLGAPAGAAQEPTPGCGGDGQIWSPGASRGPLPSQVVGVEQLLSAVRHSLGAADGRWGVAAVAPGSATDDEDLELDPPWTTLRDSRGYPYYYNSQTQTSTWDRPSLVEVGESWATNPGTCARDTPPELYQRYHRMAPRPMRGPP